MGNPRKSKPHRVSFSETSTSPPKPLETVLFMSLGPSKKYTVSHPRPSTEQIASLLHKDIESITSQTKELSNTVSSSSPSSSPSPTPSTFISSSLNKKPFNVHNSSNNQKTNQKTSKTQNNSLNEVKRSSNEGDENSMYQTPRKRVAVSDDASSKRLSSDSTLIKHKAVKPSVAISTPESTLTTTATTTTTTATTPSTTSPNRIILARNTRGMAINHQKEGLFTPCTIVSYAGSNNYIVKFDDDEHGEVALEARVDRVSIITQSSTDYELGALLPRGQKVLVKCSDGFFYPGFISEKLSSGHHHYMIQYLDGDIRPAVHRKDIVLDGESSIGTHKLQVCQKVLAKWPYGEDQQQPSSSPTSSSTSGDSYCTALIINCHGNELYTVAFSKNSTRLVYSKDVTLSHRSF